MRFQVFVIPALFVFGGCKLTDVEIVPSPELVVAAVTVVLTVDDPLQPSQAELSVVALITRSERSQSYEIPGAKVRIIGEHGQSMLLQEVPDPVATCLAPHRRDGARHPSGGSCYIGRVWPSPITPGERLSLEVALPDGRLLTGASRLPGFLSPSGLSLTNGRCRLQPDTGYRFAWSPVPGASAVVAEAQLAGLGEHWSRDDPLYLPVTLRGRDHTTMVFPRDFLYELIEREEWELHRVLHKGLPAGAAADVMIGAVDRNWANWIRVRRGLEGEVRVPSVFGDGTGWFGTAVGWKLGIESRETDPEADDDLPLCGPPTA